MAKIVLFHPWIWLKGGAERVCLEILKNSKHDVEIFTLVWDKKQTFPEFKKYSKKIHLIENNFKMGSFARKGFMAGLRLIPRKIPFQMFNYDGIIISSAGIAELIAIRNHDIPVGIYCHTPLRILHDPTIQADLKARFRFRKYLYPILSRAYGFYEKIAWNKLTLIMCNSQNVKQRIQNGNLTKQPINIIYPAVDTKKYTPKKQKQKMFFVAGRICPYKRQHLAVQAFKEFKKDKRFKDFRLVIAGNTRPEHQSYLKDLTNSTYCEPHEKSYKIKITENPTDQEMIKLYQNAKAMIFTAQAEDFGMVPCESMATGTPVIGVNEGGVRESVVDGKTGYLVETNPKAIAQAMKKIATQKGNPFYGACIKRVEEKFTWKKFIDNFDTAIDIWLIDEEQPLDLIAQITTIKPKGKTI